MLPSQRLLPELLLLLLHLLLLRLRLRPLLLLLLLNIRHSSTTPPPPIYNSQITGIVADALPACACGFLMPNITTVRP